MSPPADRSFTAAKPWRDASVVFDSGETLKLRLYGDGGHALVLHFHGGGFIGGSLDSGAAVAQVLADAGAVVASLDYPLAPAQPFPQAVEAGHAALVWLDRQRRRLLGAAAPRARLFVAGEEAGGNIAAAVALMARDRGGPALAGQILLSPMLDVCIATASQRAAKEGPMDSPCARAWQAYLANATDALHPYAVPGRSMRLAHLPPTVLVTSQDDALRDETRHYAQRLRAAGVEACSTVLPFDTGWPRSYQQPGRPAWSDAVQALMQPLFEPSPL